MDEFKNRLATAEHKRSKLAYRSMEITQIEAQKGKKIDKTHNKIRDVGQHKRSNLSEIPKKNKKQKFPPLVKYINKL